MITEALKSIDGYYDSGFYYKVIEAMGNNEIKTYIETQIDHSIKYNYCIKKIRSLIIEGKLETAFEDIIKIKNEIDDENNIYFITLDIIEMEALFIKGQWDECIARIETTIEKVEKDKIEPKFHAIPYYLFGLIHVLRGKYNIALENLNQAKEITMQQDDYEFLPQILGSISRYHRSKGEFELALEYASEAVRVSQQINNQYKYANSLLFLGNIYTVMKKFDKALEYMRLSYNICKDNKFQNILGSATANIGGVYNDMGMLEDAIKYFKQSYDVFDKLDVKHQKSITLNNIGNAYRYQGKLDIALGYLEKSLDIEKELNSLDGISYELTNIVKIHVLKGDLHQARARLAELQDILVNFDDPGFVIRAFMESGKLYFYENKLKEALDDFQNAFRLAEMHGVRFDESEPLFELVRVLSLEQMTDITPNRGKMISEYLKKLDNIAEDGRGNLVRSRRELAHLYSQIRVIPTDLSILDQLHASINNLLQSDMGDVYLEIQALLIKCTLLLNRIKLQPTNSSIEIDKNDLESTLAQISNLSEDAGMYPMIIRNYLLSAKVALLFEETERAKAFLYTTKEYISTQELVFFSHLLDDEISDYLEFVERKNAKGDGSYSWDEQYEYLSIDQYLELIINEQLEYLTASDFVHKQNPLDESSTLCGRDQEKMTDHTTRCIECRESSMDNMLKQMVFALLSNWVCGNCFENLKQSFISELVDSHAQHSVQLKNEFLALKSSFLAGKISWTCPSCDSAELFEIDLNEEINHLFTI